MCFSRVLALSPQAALTQLDGRKVGRQGFVDEGEARATAARIAAADLSVAALSSKVAACHRAGLATMVASAVADLRTAPSITGLCLLSFCGSSAAAHLSCSWRVVPSGMGVVLECGTSSEAVLCPTINPWTPLSVATKPQDTQRSPPAPLMTSALQQAASSRLGLGSAATMAAAQTLYEGGDGLGGLQVVKTMMTMTMTEHISHSMEKLRKQEILGRWPSRSTP